MAHTAIGHFMNQKDFHPNNFQNQKKVWIAKQKLKAEQAREKERIAEYQAEQAAHDTKGYALMSRAESDLAVKRHAVNFLYDAPPGTDAGNKDDGAPLELDKSRQLSLEEKLPFLKGAPREGDYAKDLPARDQPFGMEQRNVKCRRCGEWGHQSTDRICKLFAVPRYDGDEEAPRQEFEDPAVLMKQMAREGYALKQSALGRQMDANAENQQIIVDGGAGDPDVEFLASLSKSEKKKLYKKLVKLEREQNNSAGAADEEWTESRSHSKKSKKEKKVKKEKKHRKSKKGSRERTRKNTGGNSSSDSEDGAGRYSNRRHRSRSPIRRRDYP